MNEISFSGQQTDEIILYHTRSSNTVRYLFYMHLFLVSLIIFSIFFVFQSVLPLEQISLILLGILISIIFFFVGWWWKTASHNKEHLYITDRRIVKITPLSPFHTTVRTLFWSDTIKSKSYRNRGLTSKIMGVGNIEIIARTSEKDNIDVQNLEYYDDLANYIDKILFTYKNKPQELTNFPSFIPKPRGQRN